MYEMLTSYLNNRKQYTECNKSKSQLKTVLCGIPQRSTLGPLLFSLYINDLPLLTASHVNFFADDTVLSLKDKNIANLKLKVNEKLKVPEVDKWKRANRLSLNCNKSSYFVGHSGRKNGALTNFALSTGEHSIPSISAKYLGITVDQQLSWKDHINHITTKLANAARISSKLRHYASKKNLVKLYYSFAYPYLKYGITSWGSGSATMFK